MVRIGIVLGSTRPGRKAEDVGRWVAEIASRRSDAEYEILDIADFGLPLLDEALPPAMGRYEHEHTRVWAEAVARYDGYVFVTPEYNHSIPGALKNALDFVYGEWNDKAAAIVGYGSAGGVRAAEQLRLVLAELQIADVRQQVALSLSEDFQDYTEFTPRGFQDGTVEAMLDQLIPWTTALRSVRQSAEVPV